MAAGWSTVLLVAAAGAGGYIAGDWVRQQEVTKEQVELRKAAEAAVDRAVKAERKAASLDQRLKEQRTRVQDDIAQSDLVDCPVPESVSGVLNQMAKEASRAGAGAEVR